MYRLEELGIYNLAQEIGDEVWFIVQDWEAFSKFTIGKQFVRAIDSVSANISEGYGRYYFKENIHFCLFARGSILESKTWLTKAFNRKLISQKDYDTIIEKLSVLHKNLNSYIKSLRTNITKQPLH